MMLFIMLWNVGGISFASERENNLFTIKSDKTNVLVGETVTISLYSNEEYSSISTFFARIDYDENSFVLDKNHSSITDLNGASYIIDNSYEGYGLVTGITSNDFARSSMNLKSGLIAELKFIAVSSVKNAKFEILKLEICDHDYEISTENLRIGNAIEISVNEQPETKESVLDIFKDLVKGSWYIDAVQYVYDKGIMSGSKGLFHPTKNVTREQVIATLYNLEGNPKVVDYAAVNELKDVQSGKWYTDAVCWAYNTGVASGNSSTKLFGIGNSITRQQLAMMLFNYAGIKGYDTAVRKDYSSLQGAKEVASYAVDAMQWAYGTELISGSKTIVNGTAVYHLNPVGNATRAQMASILMKFCEKNNL